MVSSRWGARFVALVAGLLAALSQPPISWPWVLGVALPVMFWLWSHTATRRRAFWIGWFAGLGYFGATLQWIVEPFLVQPEIFGWMIPFALTGMAGGMALFWGAGFWVAKRIAAVGWGAPFGLTFGLVGMEWLRGNVLSGFPWSLLGYAWIDTDAMQFASIAGVYGLTLLTVLSGFLIGAAVFLPGTIRRAVSGTLAIAIITAPFLFALDRLQNSRNVPLPSAPNVGLVQPNVAQKDKWQPALREAHLRDLLDKTRDLTGRGANVVIWPEAATPYQFSQAPQLRAMIADALGPNAVLLAGGVRFEGESAFNSLIVVGPGGDILDTYDKQHLVPFGEKMPLEPLLSRIGLRAMISLPGGFSTGGDRERSMTVDGLPPFVPMICYEAIFPAEIMRRAGPGEWLVQVTNDAWFGNWVGPYQHLVMARVRAIERGLPLARSANTGVSAIIDGYGRIVKSLPLNEAGVVMQPLPNRAALTVYAQFEDGPFGVVLMLCGLLALAGRRRAIV